MLNGMDPGLRRDDGGKMGIMGESGVMEKAG
jgi:hypothetical protein